MSIYNTVAQTSENTVVASYEPVQQQDKGFQSEAELEQTFIEQLIDQGYSYANIKSFDDLKANLRECIEKLNSYTFASDDEWNSFYDNYIANGNDGIEDKAVKFHKDHAFPVHTDSGETKNIKIVDKTNIHNNILQVINQYAVTQKEGAKHDNRYDVTILLNGLPIVHIELKRRGVNIKEAFNQINRYHRESFFANDGIFDYVQIYVISNGTETKYYSNSTRREVVTLNDGTAHRKTASKSYEFTMYWADAKNDTILDLVDFTKTFFAKHTLLNVLINYCVLKESKELLVMRPYQIVACERILNRINVAYNQKRYGKIEGGGYIWHTTGSGKTLTSFKTSQLASELPYIDRVLFVVDRKDLDYQTMKEYDAFSKGAANSNKSTSVLTRQLTDPIGEKNPKTIITTIQKLATFIKKNKTHDIYNKHVVIIFDECHRSQFGKMHKAIAPAFKSYYIFGFTGTPIFAANKGGLNGTQYFTTEQTFGDQLHNYTIVNAINDHNVLKFKIDYIKTMSPKDEVDDKDVYAIEKKAVLMEPERIKLVTGYILKHFDAKTCRNEKSYKYRVIQNVSDVASDKYRGIEGKEVIEQKQTASLKGFNSILAVADIDMARLYYNEFKKQDPYKRLKVATIFSYEANQEEADVADSENPEDVNSLSATDKEFLSSAIDDYNKMFSSNYSVDADSFQNYYKDVSLRMKNREIDILIVVNMFLTGFDATTLNTLWVDKNLKMHGLIQAFSRTNRILNSVKAYGNIVCFRNLESQVNEALSIFGDKDARGIVLIKTFKEYLNGYHDETTGEDFPGFISLVDDLYTKFEHPQNLKTDEEKIEFIKLFGTIIRTHNILKCFDEYDEVIPEILSEREFQDLKSAYLRYRDEIIPKIPTEEIAKDVVFEMELIRQTEVNVDYILMLVNKYRESNCKDEEIKASIIRAVGSSPSLRSKKDLILEFLDRINASDDIYDMWIKYIEEKCKTELDSIIEELNLKQEKTYIFMTKSFNEGRVNTLGTEFPGILPPIKPFDKTRTNKKQAAADRLTAFFEKYSGLNVRIEFV